MAEQAQSAGGGQAKATGPITPASIGQELGRQFAAGSSVIESAQTLPPPTGLRTQVRCSHGDPNYTRLTREQMEADVKPQFVRANTKDKAPEAVESTYKRTQFGKPAMAAATELPTLEAVTIRSIVSQREQHGQAAPPHMRFATLRQVNALNVAYGGESRSDAQLVRHTDGRRAEGVPFNLKEVDPIRRVVSEKKDAAGNVERDSRGEPIRETVEKEKSAAEIAKETARNLKRLYNVDDVRVDRAPIRMYCPDHINHDKAGKVLVDENGRPSTQKSGDVIRGADGKAVKNYDENGKSVEARVGDYQRNSDGSIVTGAVEKFSRSPMGVSQGITVADQIIRNMKEDLAAAGIEVKSARGPKEVSISSSVAKDGKETLTIGVPSKFKNADTELTEKSRLIAHMHQWMDDKSPNHDAARKAAAMPAKSRAASPEFARCELTAQHAALATVTRAGGTYQPQTKETNDKYRENWVKQMNTADGVRDFGRSTDMASRVCNGKEPTRNLQREKNQQRQAESLERSAADRQGAAQQERGGREAVGLGGFGSVRGAERPVGGQAPTPASGTDRKQEKQETVDWNPF